VGAAVQTQHLRYRGVIELLLGRFERWKTWVSVDLSKFSELTQLSSNKAIRFLPAGPSNDQAFQAR